MGTADASMEPDVNNRERSLLFFSVFSIVENGLEPLLGLRPQLIVLHESSRARVPAQNGVIVS